MSLLKRGIGRWHRGPLRWVTGGVLSLMMVLVSFSLTPSLAFAATQAQPPGSAIVVGPGCGNADSQNWNGINGHTVYFYAPGGWLSTGYNPASPLQQISGGDYSGSDGEGGWCDNKVFYAPSKFLSRNNGPLNSVATFEWSTYYEGGSTCNVYAYIPQVNASAVERFDFWSSTTHWLAWTGSNYNTDNMGGWYRIASNLYSPNPWLNITLTNVGSSSYYLGIGDMAFDCKP